MKMFVTSPAEVKSYACTPPFGAVAGGCYFLQLWPRLHCWFARSSREYLWLGRWTSCLCANRRRKYCRDWLFLWYKWWVICSIWSIRFIVTSVQTWKHGYASNIKVLFIIFFFFGFELNNSIVYQRIIIMIIVCNLTNSHLWQSSSRSSGRRGWRVCVRRRLKCQWRVREWYILWNLC